MVGVLVSGYEDIAKSACFFWETWTSHSSYEKALNIGPILYK